MFSSKITTTCLMGVLVFACLGLTKVAVEALGAPMSAAAEVATADDDGDGAASEPGTVAASTRAASTAPALEAHRPKVVPRRRGMS